MEARSEPDGYKEIIDGGDEYSNCTKKDIIKLNDKCIYLISALTIALKHFPKKTWRECCQEASQTCSIFATPYSGRTIEEWWTVFREKNVFPHPRGFDAALKPQSAMLPPVLRYNEDLRRKFIRFCTQHVTDLNINVAREYVIKTLLPAAFELTSNEEKRVYKISEDPSRSTIWEWMTRCGLKYKKRTKSFFVDTHESLPNRKYRKEQTARYLKRERLMHRWYQMGLKEALEFEKKELLLPGKGYRYENEDGLEMVELHVDELPESALLTRINNECKFGGNLSVRRGLEERPIFSFSQDECNFRQFSFTGSSWTGPKGEQGIIPKDEGNGLMISAFQSREFGFGMSLLPAELEKVNKFRMEKRPLYTETESAIKVNGTAIKKPLASSPFVVIFEYGYGAGKEGYWTYDHMCLQYKDCVDTIQALYPEYDSVWIFDHSCGHDRGREDGLTVGNMRVNWGGKQSRVRDTLIQDEAGYLGPHSPKLQVGDIQKMVFEEGDDGPYYMNPINRQLHRYDQVKGKKIKKRLKKDLCSDLERLGYNVLGKTLKEVQDMATGANLPITVEELDVIEGWVGKPKGMRQVLWERGLLDPEVTYVAKLRKDDPNYDEKKEYGAVLADCTDFLNEKTSLMYLGERLGVEVDRSTKSHPELAGEGIEYSWGRAKCVYRRAPLEKKKLNNIL